MTALCNSGGSASTGQSDSCSDTGLGMVDRLDYLNPNADRRTLSDGVSEDCCEDDVNDEQKKESITIHRM